jgi:hypothetical protein
VTHPRPALEHYRTHTNLLQPARQGRATLDAIVVPASRPASNLDSVLRLGAGLGVETVVLCSRNTRLDDVLAIADSISGARCTAVDLSTVVVPMPALETATFADAAISWHGDLSVKRNLGLVLGRAIGWSTLLFLDDDIRDLGPTQVQNAVGTLQFHAATGMPATFHPDNSAVCQARRLGLGDQEVFVGGSALAVSLDRVGSFFPEIYNEDWLFLAPYLERREVAAGAPVRQKSRDPYTPGKRVAEEEFGDVIGEGMIGQLHTGPLFQTRSREFWVRFLDLRAEFIADTTEACRRSGHRDAERALAALATAEKTRAHLSPDRLAEYAASWFTDLDTWRRYLSQIVRPGDLRAALDQLGLPAESVGPRPARNSRP